MNTQAPTAEIKPGRCIICEAETSYRWTDSHGIGACLNCGAPYRLFHYEKGGDGQQRRIAGEPVCLIKSAWLPLTRQYWQAVGRNVDPGAYNFPGSSYEIATKEDFEASVDWFEAHREDWPKE